MIKRISYIFILLAFAAINSFGQERKLEPSDYLKPSFHAEKRAQLRSIMPNNSVAVFFANPIRNRANDTDYLYHQDPNFYYLTGYPEPHAVLMIFKEFQTSDQGKYNEILFVQPRNPMAELWLGRRLGDEGAKDKLALNNVFNNTEFENYNLDFSKFDQVLFYDFFNDVRDDARNKSDLFDLISQFKAKVGYPSDAPTLVQEPERQNLNTSLLDTLMANMRGIKTAEEIALIRKAVDISCIGQVEVMKAMKPGMSEREVQGIHEFVFKKYGSEYEGYNSIVGAGNNGCILHYVENNLPEVVSNEMILMDLGAEYRGYTADVTRTIPVDGKFSPEEKTIYELVLQAQEAAMEITKPGTTWMELEMVSRKIINEGLVELGIAKKGERHLFYPHGLGHHIGLDVHDKGTYDKLEAGMTITIEPGIYIPAGSKCDEKWWDIAVRIEDDILVTNDGYELLSDIAPRTVKDIEAMMEQPSPLDAFNLPELDTEAKGPSGGK